MIDEDRSLLNELKKKLPIDIYNLEEECRNQPVLHQEVSEAVADAKRRAKTAAKHVEFVKADLLNRIRREPEKYGLSKVTETSVDAAAVVQPVYQEAIRKMLDAEEYASALAGLEVAMMQRKSMLNDEVALFLKSYYTTQEMVGEVKSLDKVTEEQIIAKRIRRAKQRKAGE